MLRQHAYTVHGPSQKRFPRNVYIVNDVGDLRELDRADMSCLASHNDGNKYLLKAIDALSKYSYSVPIRSKTGGVVCSGFRSLLSRTGCRKPLVVRREKGK
jgi:hypothetical protein